MHYIEPEKPQLNTI